MEDPARAVRAGDWQAADRVSVRVPGEGVGVSGRVLTAVIFFAVGCTNGIIYRKIFPFTVIHITCNSEVLS